MSELITIKVLNWGKHQAGATRYDSTSWFKLKNSLISNEVWDCLNDAEFRFFIFLLCFISQKQHKTGIVSVHINTLNRISVIQKKTILTALDKLEELQIIECNHRAKTVQSPCENSAKAALEKRREEKRRSNIKITDRNFNIECSERKNPFQACGYFSDPILVEFFQKAQIKTSTQLLWLKTYENADWLKQEIFKAIAWLDANPHKRPKKNFSRFLSNWFSRGFERYRKTLRSVNNSDRFDFLKNKAECLSE